MRRDLELSTYYASEPDTIQELFGLIAPYYDRANTGCSLGLHHLWNRALITAMGPADLLLDLCAGTGEISLRFLKKNPHAIAFLLDFSAEMLQRAEKKGRDRALITRMHLLQADAQRVPLANESVDAVTIAYGIRNVSEPLCCFREVYRVLRAGGRFGIIELTRPNRTLLRVGHQLYTRYLLPPLGKLLTQNKEAYAYLARSIQHFASPDTLVSLLKDTGFQKVSCRPLFGGIATLFLAHKPIECFFLRAPAPWR